jgi:uncharacterized protein (DUF58 family)
VLTRQGLLTIVAGVVLVVTGRVFAVTELYVAGAALVMLPLACLVYVRFTHLRLRIGRVVTPTRVHAGDLARVEVRARNVHNRPTPVLRLRDPVGGTRGAELSLAPLTEGEVARAAYRLPTARRGVVRIGPLEVDIADPLGLARRSAIASPRLDLTVFPHIEVVNAPRGGGERDPHGSTVQNTLSRQGDEFFGLREYVVGDDLRHVHWASSARFGDLMIRQDETPWQDRSTVLLDVRRSAHTEQTFEAAVSAAASIVTAAGIGRHFVRFLTTAGIDSGFGAGEAHVEAILEHLAVVESWTLGSLREVLVGLRRGPRGGAFVGVLGRGGAHEIELLASLTRGFKRVYVLAPDVAGSERNSRRIAVVRYDANGFGPAWDVVQRTSRVVRTG